MRKREKTNGSTSLLPNRMVAITLLLVLSAMAIWLLVQALSGLGFTLVRADEALAPSTAQGESQGTSSHLAFLPMVLKLAVPTTTDTPTATRSPTPTGNWIPPQELLVYDWNGPVTKANHGLPQDIPPLDSANSDWTEPTNFAEGTLYYRVEIRSQPVPKPMRLQFCFWQYSQSLENCGPTMEVSGTPGAVATYSGRVQAMYMKNGLPIDWTSARDAVGVIIRNSAGLEVSDLNGWNWHGENPDEWYPLNMRFTVVVVAKGASFSGWPYWLDPTPTPTATGTATNTPTATPEHGSWWDTRWRARVKIELDGSGYERADKVLEVPINFTGKLQDAGLTGPLDEANLRVIETDADDYVLNDQVPFQFDKDPDYQAASKASGLLVLMAQGQTGPAQTRRFYVYLDTLENANGKTPANPPVVRISYQDNLSYQGQASYKIMTENATYYYHKLGAGFASMIDTEGYDWVSYHPTGGSAGSYRGIPNLATDTGGEDVGLFHPGFTLSTSSIVNSGPLKLTIKSKTNDGVWQKTWEIYPKYARMTLLKKPALNRYWFLYEGTPGGSISPEDFYVLPDGVKKPLTTEIQTDLAGEEWIYFGDEQRNHLLYVANHQEDAAPDCHYVMQDNMTVFGFGRNRNNIYQKLLNALPGYFTIGFLDTADHQGVTQSVHAAYKPLAFTVWSGESPTTIPVPVTPSPTPTEPLPPEVLVYDWNQTVKMGNNGFAMDSDPAHCANFDWTNPVNFVEGTLQFRAEVRNQPVPQQSMRLEFCFWQYQPSEKEACGTRRQVPGFPGTLVTWSTDVQNMTKDQLDWRLEREKCGFSVRNAIGPVSSYYDWNWSGENPAEWYPLDMRFTVVLTAKNTPFSGWDYWVTQGNSIPAPFRTLTPTPTPTRTPTSTPTETPTPTDSPFTGP